MGRVAIVTDSSIDLSPGQASGVGAFLAPISYELGGQRYQSGQQTAAEFFDALKAGSAAALSGVDADDFERSFSEAAEGADELICICQSFGSSFTYVAAQVASRRVADDTGTPIRIINSGRSTAAQAAITIVAGRAAQRDATADEVMRVIEATTPRSESFAIAPSVDQLDRAGQLQAVTTQSGVGSLEHAVPLFRVRDRLRALAVADDAGAAELDLLERAERVAAGDAVTLVVTHALAPEAAEGLRAAAEARLKVSETVVTEMGPTLGSLLGAGAYGLGFCPGEGG